MNEHEGGFPSIEQLEEELERERGRKKRKRIRRGIFLTLLVLLLAAGMTAALMMPVLRISGVSMADTLQDGDLVVARNDGQYQAGDVVALRYRDGILVKRVIATAGQWVELDREGNVYINEKLLDEPYVTDRDRGTCDLLNQPYLVQEGECIVMGDHRSTSIDSRSSILGPVEDEAVIGKLLLRIWPLNAVGSIE